MWLGGGSTLTGKFRYFNSDDLAFDEIGHYIAWIHVLLLSDHCMLLLNSGTGSKVNNQCHEK